MISLKSNGRQRAIVIGGSFTGLLAARVLSEHFEQVTIIERDELKDLPEARKGQPQARHAHSLLAHGFDVLTRYFPDLPERLLSQGATLSDMGSDLRWWACGGYRRQFTSGLTFASMSRPLLEWQIRQCVIARPNIVVLDNHNVASLAASSDRKRVVGVNIVNRSDKNREARLTADLVLDTSGHGASAQKWLNSIGYSGPKEETVKIDVSYTCRVYRRSADDLADADILLVTPNPPHEKRMAVVVPWEGDRWIVSLAGWGGDRAPTEEVGFSEFARSLPVPDVYQLISCLEPLSDIISHRIPSNLRRRYEKLSRFPAGYLVMGDAICRFNPVFAQGMTSAALQAQTLDQLLNSRRSLRRLWKPYFKRVATVVDIPWQLALGEDFRFPETSGRKPFGTDLINAYVDKVQQATHRDEVVYDAFLKVMNLMAPASSLMRPDLMWRVLRSRSERAPASLSRVETLASRRV